MTLKSTLDSASKPEPFGDIDFCRIFRVFLLTIHTPSGIVESAFRSCAFICIAARPSMA
jgi:hypothetical protein